jgi:hypothetical protein
MNLLRFVFRILRWTAEVFVLGFLFLVAAFLLLYGMFRLELDAAAFGVVIAVVFVSALYTVCRFE